MNEKILFVCTGNTCRSPLAAAVTNALETARRAALPKELQSLLPRALVADSRGLYADGGPISEGALQALQAAEIPPVEGHDYRTHVSATIDETDAERFDLLCAVGARHAMELLLRFPQHAGKILRLPQEIPDPYGGDALTYRRCLAAITESVRELFFADSAPTEGKERSEE